MAEAAGELPRPRPPESCREPAPPRALPGRLAFSSKDGGASGTEKPQAVLEDRGSEPTSPAADLSIEVGHHRQARQSQEPGADQAARPRAPRRPPPGRPFARAGGARPDSQRSDAPA
ncbi:unnamed protein product, partial [Prorocentrum cordatum]